MPGVKVEDVRITGISGRSRVDQNGLKDGVVGERNGCKRDGPNVRIVSCYNC
jgi:hypothetical protein